MTYSTDWGGGKILAVSTKVDVSTDVDVHLALGSLGSRSLVSEDDTRNQNTGRGVSGLQGMEDTMAAKLAIHERVAEVFVVRWAGQCLSNGGVEE